MAKFLCSYEVRIGDTELNYYHIDKGKNEDEVAEKNEVEHGDDGLDTEDSPIGGANGQYYTELCNVIKITPAQEKFLKSIGIN